MTLYELLEELRKISGRILSIEAQCYERNISIVLIDRTDTLIRSRRHWFFRHEIESARFDVIGEALRQSALEMRRVEAVEGEGWSASQNARRNFPSRTHRHYDQSSDEA